MPLPDQANGPARALMLCLPGCWVAMGLLDGLATVIRFRLSSLSAGPDAMAVGVVFAGGPLNPLPTLIRIAVACPSAGPDVMLVGGVFTGRPAVACGPLGPAGKASSGHLTHGRCAAWKLVGSGRPSAAMMPILVKSVGGDKPQNRVRKSTRFCFHDAVLVLAMQADDATA